MPVVEPSDLARQLTVAQAHPGKKQDFKRAQWEGIHPLVAGR